MLGRRDSSLRGGGGPRQWRVVRPSGSLALRPGVARSHMGASSLFSRGAAAASSVKGPRRGRLGRPVIAVRRRRIAPARGCDARSEGRAKGCARRDWEGGARAGGPLRRIGRGAPSRAEGRGCRRSPGSGSRWPWRLDCLEGDAAAGKQQGGFLIPFDEPRDAARRSDRPPKGRPIRTQRLFEESRRKRRSGRRSGRRSRLASLHGTSTCGRP